MKKQFRNSPKVIEALAKNYGFEKKEVIIARFVDIPEAGDIAIDAEAGKEMIDEILKDYWLLYGWRGNVRLSREIRTVVNGSYNPALLD